VVLDVVGAYVALIAACHADLAQLVPPPTRKPGRAGHRTATRCAAAR
jgi:hypothetical protein